MEPKTGKRIVSKREYVSNQSDRAIFVCIGIGVWLLAVVLALFAVGCCLALLGNMYVGSSIGDKVATGIFCLLGAGMAGAGAYYCRMAGTELLKDAAMQDPGVPLTRANVADLPAPNSLVRASAEPVQEQQTVLLRAAEAGQERHEEQLVRAVKGQE